MDASSTPPLVNIDWLNERLRTPGLVVLDASFFLPAQGRDARQEFLAGHIPGAQFFDIDLVADRNSPLPHMLPSPSVFADAVSELGIGADTQVVVYDSNYFMASARAWWTFRVFGHGRVAVLDGGIARWKAAGFPVDARQHKPDRRPFESSFRAELVFDARAIRALLQGGGGQLLDARSPGRFAGTEPEPRAGLRVGHIPGSRNLFFRELIDGSSLCLKPPDALVESFQLAGIDPAQPVVATCGTGVTASILALGLYQVGNRNAAVYDGSWTEWGALEGAPIETGPVA